MIRVAISALVTTAADTNVSDKKMLDPAAYLATSSSGDTLLYSNLKVKASFGHNLTHGFGLL